MSCPSVPPPVKLLVSLFSAREPLLQETLNRLAGLFGPVDEIGPRLFFDKTTYYQAEMGWPLHRRFATFERLVRAEQLVAVKLAALELERAASSEDGRRLINIDPGILSAERLILATGKNFTHRVYLSEGIYADLTLIFRKGSFRPLEWTYPDYASQEVIAWLNGVRGSYLAQLREEKGSG